MKSTSYHLKQMVSRRQVDINDQISTTFIFNVSCCLGFFHSFWLNDPSLLLCYMTWYRKKIEPRKTLYPFDKKWEIKEKEITFHVLSVHLVNTTSSYCITLFKETFFSYPEINLLFYNLFSFKHMKYMKLSLNMWIIFGCYLTSFLNNQKIYLVLQEVNQDAWYVELLFIMDISR